MNGGRMRQQHPTLEGAFAYRVEESDVGTTVYLDQEVIELGIARKSPSEGWCRWQGRLLPFATTRIGDELHLWVDGALFIFRCVEERSKDRRALIAEDGERITPRARTDDASPTGDDSGYITSRITGSVLLVSVQPGDYVAVGDEVCVIEAMKMEHSIRAAASGVVREVGVVPGQQVYFGDVLMALEEGSEDD